MSFSHYQPPLAEGLVRQGSSAPFLVSRCDSDSTGYLARSSDLRRCWCPPPGRYHIDVSLRAEFDIEARQAVKDVDAAQEALIDIFERIENFFKRLEKYTEVKPSEAMTDVLVKIMVEVLNILGTATKEIKQGRTSELPIRLHLYRFR